MPSEGALHYSNIHFYRKSLRHSCRRWLEAIAWPVIPMTGIYIHINMYPFTLTFIRYPTYFGTFVHENVP